ncbi:calcium-binding protein [Inquilinus sp.]|jgi:Ca2+-binding RTX toxin-like protein|uniref:calcium-binding protein n=1 Tax=Inquilinus sp. TaxID=1932117 RepID=UPI003784E186
MPITKIISGTGANEFFHVRGDGLVVPAGYVDRTDATAADDMILGGGGNDIVHGGGGLDFIRGDDGNDKLYGEAGDDQLSGGAGSDELYGGAGDDIYSIGAGDLIVEGLGQGIDMVYASIPDYTLPANVENGSGQGLTGNALDNELTGTRLFGLGGADILNGQLGDDLLSGGTGADDLFGAPGFDTADYSTSSAGVWVSLLANLGLRGDAQGDTLLEIEALLGSAGADTLIGDGAANRLDGGSGDDTLEGGAGADTLIGGAGIDTAYYTTSSAGVAVNLTTGTGIGVDAVGDTLSGIEQLSGSNFGDMLSGDSGANGLWGGAGDDALTGGAGADRLKGGAGKDLFIYVATSDSTVAGIGRDTINDFGSGDRIDVSSIDADGQIGNGDTAFRFVSGAFTGHAGEIRIMAQSGYQAVYLDIDGDKAADSAIMVLSDHALTAADFVL